MRSWLLAAVLALAPMLAQANMPEDVEPAVFEVSINGTPTGEVGVFWWEGENLMADGEQWKTLGLILSEEELARVVSSQELELTLEIDEAIQTLSIQAPAARMPEQRAGGDRPTMPELAAPAPGVLINYNVAGSVSKEHQAVSLGHEIRTGGKWGVLTHSGQLNASEEGLEYVRGQTTWQKDDYKRQITYQVGDVVAAGGARLGGVRIAKDPEALDPYTPVFPMPTIGGLAVDAGTLQILTEQGKVSEHEIERGPFVIDRYPLRNGRNNYTVVVKDKFGRTVEVPEASGTRYFTTAVLRDGLTTWDIAAGKVRQGFTDSYGEPAVAASVAHGVTDKITVRGEVQATRDARATTVGATMVAGTWGVVNVEAGQSDSERGKGKRMAVGYNYSGPNVGVSLSHERREDWWDLGQSDAFRIQPDEITRAALTWGNDDRTLAARVGYVDIKTGDDRTRFVEAGASYNKGSHTVSARAIHDLEDRETTFEAAYRYSFGNSSVHARATKAPEINSAAVGLTHSGDWRDMPYRAQVEAQQRGPDRTVRANANLITQKGEARVDVSHSEQGTTVAGSWAGAVHIGKGGVSLLRPVYDGYAVIDVPGVEGIPVKINNQLVGKTNKRGRLVAGPMPSLSASKISLDDKALPIEVQLDGSEMEVAPQRMAGAHVVFPVSSMNSRVFTITRDTPIEPGAVAKTSAEETQVGYDGELFLEKAGGGLEVAITDQHGTCTVQIPDPLPAFEDRVELACK